MTTKTSLEELACLVSPEARTTLLRNIDDERAYRDRGGDRPDDWRVNRLTNNGLENLREALKKAQAEEQFQAWSKKAEARCEKSEALLQPWVDRKEIWISQLEGEVVGMAADGTEVSIGQVENFESLQAYLTDHPTPDTW